MLLRQVFRKLYIDLGTEQTCQSAIYSALAPFMPSANPRLRFSPMSEMRNRERMPSNHNTADNTNKIRNLIPYPSYRTDTVRSPLTMSLPIFVTFQWRWKICCTLTIAVHASTFAFMASQFSASSCRVKQHSRPGQQQEANSFSLYEKFLMASQTVTAVSLWRQIFDSHSLILSQFYKPGRPRLLARQWPPIAMPWVLSGRLMPLPPGRIPIIALRPGPWRPRPSEVDRCS